MSLNKYVHEKKSWMKDIFISKLETGFLVAKREILAEALSHLIIIKERVFSDK